jgi:hypothetical protein
MSNETTNEMMYSIFRVVPPASGFYVPTFFLLTPPTKMEQCVPKRRHIKVSRRGITQKKEYNIQNTVKV